MKKILFACAAGALMLSTTSVMAVDGKAVYDKACIACHHSGAAGAPRLGDKEAWASRIAMGIDALYEISFNGKPGTAMLARGTCGACTDDELKAAVDYMVAESQ